MPEQDTPLIFEKDDASYSMKKVDQSAAIYRDITISDNENTISLIDEIAVSEDGVLAVSFSNKSVNIYDPSLDFAYSIELNRSHCGMYLEWDAETLHIYVSGSNQYDVQLLHGDLTAYSIADTEKSAEKWRSIYHSSGGGVQSIQNGDRTYYMTRTNCWCYDGATSETEMIVDVLPSMIKAYSPILVILLPVLLIVIFTKVKDVKERKRDPHVCR